MKKYCDEVKCYVKHVDEKNFDGEFHKIYRSLVARGLNPRERAGLLDRAIVADHHHTVEEYITKRERLDHCDQAPKSLSLDVARLEEILRQLGLSCTKREYLERIQVSIAQERKRAAKHKSAKRRSRGLAHQKFEEEEDLEAIAADAEREHTIQQAMDIGYTREEAIDLFLT